MNRTETAPDYLMGTSLDDLDGLRFVGRLEASPYCKSRLGDGRPYRLHKCNPRWETIEIICRNCAGAVKRFATE